MGDDLYFMNTAGAAWERSGWNDIPANTVFILGVTKPIAALVGVGVIRPEPDGAGGTVGATTVGPGQLLSNRIVNGTLTINGTGTVQDCIVNGKINTTGAGWLIENCDIRGPAAGLTGSAQFMVSTSGSTGLGGEIRFSKVKPTVPNAWTNGIGASRFKSYRNDISGVVDCYGAFPSTAGQPVDVKIWGDYSHDMSLFRPDYANSNRPRTHNDNLQHQGGDGVDVFGSWLSAYLDPTIGDMPDPDPQTQLATVMVNNNVGNATGLVVRNCWLDGGEFCVNVGSTTGVSEVSFFDNIFDYGARQFPGDEPRTYAISIKAAHYIPANVSGNEYIDGTPVVRRVG